MKRPATGMKPPPLAGHSRRAEARILFQGGNLSETVRTVSGYTALLVVLAVILGIIAALATIFACLLL